MQIAELMAMSNSVLLPPTATATATERRATHADLRPYYLKDLDTGERPEMAAAKSVPTAAKTAAVTTKSKKHK